MRDDWSKINKHRVRFGNLASDDQMGRNGAFMIPFGNHKLAVIASDCSDWESSGLTGEAFEHVSVSLDDRCPTWDEMCFIKDMFWKDDEVVMQLHPAKKDYINCHPHCLHLWKPNKSNIPLPPSICVGPA